MNSPSKFSSLEHPNPIFFENAHQGIFILSATI